MKVSNAAIRILFSPDLVHMNGRIYDPLAGRFLSPDPTVQFPNNAQNFNRYSYVLNNPLSYMDPSGYFLSGLKKFFKKFWRPILAIVVSVITAGAFIAAYYSAMGVGSFSISAGIGSIFNGGFLVGSTVGTMVSGGVLVAAGAVGGFMGGLVASGGSLKGALYGALTGAIAAGIGNHFGGVNWSNPGIEMQRALAHGISGGAIAEAQGGKFSAGFFANSFSSLSSYIPGGGDRTWGVIRASVIGGTGSVIGGGKFENGAVTAAFTHLFNETAHSVAEKSISNNSGIRKAVIFDKGIKGNRAQALEVAGGDKSLIVGVDKETNSWQALLELSEMNWNKQIDEIVFLVHGSSEGIKFKSGEIISVRDSFWRHANRILKNPSIDICISGCRMGDVTDASYFQKIAHSIDGRVYVNKVFTGTSDIWNDRYYNAVPHGTDSESTTWRYFE